MQIVVVGSIVNLNECKEKFGEAHHYLHATGHQDAERFFLKSDLVMDFMISQNPQQMEVYRDHPQVIAFLDCTNKSLLELAGFVNHQISCTLFGFCGLPTFLNRPLLETSLYKELAEDKLQNICTRLKTEFVKVDDRVGLVTPRIISMIINEAYFTLQEGTATREDIDQAMKLGTNYPFGPFEWANKIGLKNIYSLLSALYEDTKDERYKISALLRKEFLRSLEKG